MNVQWKLKWRRPTWLFSLDVFDGPLTEIQWLALCRLAERLIYLSTHTHAHTYTHTHTHTHTKKKKKNVYIFSKWWGYTSGGVYVPCSYCIYLHARWELSLLCLCDICQVLIHSFVYCFLNESRRLCVRFFITPIWSPCWCTFQALDDGALCESLAGRLSFPLTQNYGHVQVFHRTCHLNTHKLMSHLFFFCAV